MILQCSDSADCEMEGDSINASLGIISSSGTPAYTLQILSSAGLSWILKHWHSFIHAFWIYLCFLVHKIVAGSIG